MIIGISGNRLVGKDTFFKILAQLNTSCKRYAFADVLKNDLHSLLKSQFNIDIFNCDPIEKELIRPIMISYGMAWRHLNINHWVEHVYNDIKTENDTIVPVITDLRFQNELEFLRDKFGAKLIHISITRRNSVDPTEEEAKNFYKIHKKSDIQLEWGENTEDQIHHIVEKIYNDVINHNAKKFYKL